MLRFAGKWYVIPKQSFTSKYPIEKILLVFTECKYIQKCAYSE